MMRGLDRGATRWATTLAALTRSPQANQRQLLFLLFTQW